MLAIAGLGARDARADGALALGIPSNVAKDGFSYGWAYDHPSTIAAKEAALKACKTNNEGSSQAKKLCRIYDSFVGRCAAISMDPKAGTPGVGWAIDDNRDGAEKSALANCKVTAGEDREDFCEISRSICDGEKKD